MRLIRCPGVFAPISDSWMLAAALRAERLDPGAAVLDLCTGSGVLAVTAALAGAREVVAVDVSRRAVLSARVNGVLNGVRVQARRGDLFDAVSRRRFDVIVSNPPYVPGPALELPRRGPSRAWEGGLTGRALIERICAGAPAHLRPGGLLLLVQSAICGEQETVAALHAAGLEAHVVLRHRGPFGPRLRERAGWLARQGLLSGEEGHEEMIVVRGQMPDPYHRAPPTALARA